MMTDRQRQQLQQIKELCRANDAATGTSTYASLAKFIEGELSQDRGFFAYKIAEAVAAGGLAGAKQYLDGANGQYASIQASRARNKTIWATKRERDSEEMFVLEASVVSDIHALKKARGASYTEKLLMGTLK